ncbi:hypothetical protein F5Y15DRAFT_293729 [Xylariaceae sp. FL0016]|nr:hypothetical protein F5Y15DRAFT_293729 [Xylariaceae sp. FL0016]
MPRHCTCPGQLNARGTTPEPRSPLSRKDLQLDHGLRGMSFYPISRNIMARERTHALSALYAQREENHRNSLTHNDHRRLDPISEEPSTPHNIPQSSSEDTLFSKRVFKEGEEDLFVLLEDRERRHEKAIGNCEVNLGTLQRMNLHLIQKDLVDLTSCFVRDEELKAQDRLRLRELMASYCNAWRDWELIVDYTSVAEEDPFRITTHNELNRSLLNDAGLLDDDFVQNLAQRRLGRNRPLRLRPPRLCTLPGHPRHSKLKHDRYLEILTRFMWAVGASLSLIGPILVLVLETSLLTSLIVSSVSIVVFAFIVSGISGGLIPWLQLNDFGLKDVLASTLAYAAVLVVFVGLRAETYNK